MIPLQCFATSCYVLLSSRYANIRRIIVAAVTFSLFGLQLQQVSYGVDERKNFNAARNFPTQLTSGIGLVTTDGRWDIKPDVSAKFDVKILGFTDTKYLPIVKVWYNVSQGLAIKNIILPLMKWQHTIISYV